MWLVVCWWCCVVVVGCVIDVGGFFWERFVLGRWFVVCFLVFVGVVVVCGSWGYRGVVWWLG